jgi:hypothetical protein
VPNGRATSTEPLLRTELIAIQLARCRHGPKGWMPITPTARPSLFVPLRGVFKRRLLGLEHFVDPTTPYFEQPGLEQEVSHPSDESHEALVLIFADGIAEDLRVASMDMLAPLRTTPRDNYILRQLAAGLRDRRLDALSSQDTAVRIVARMNDDTTKEPSTRGASTHQMRSRIVDDARHAISARLTWLWPARTVAK